jgi:hypothetical protein
MVVELCEEEVYGEEFVGLRIGEEEGDGEGAGGGEDEQISCCLAGECK